MAIPRIEEYAGPINSSFPKNKVNWKVNPDEAVLLIHDMQDYFLDFFGQDSLQIKNLVKNIQDLKKECKRRGIKVIYSSQPDKQSVEDRGLLNDFWGKGIDTAAHRKAITPLLAPDDDDIVITKWRYSAFERTNLKELLAEMHCSQIIITGIYGHIGCLQTACHAFMMDIKPFLIGDCIADFNLDSHQWTLDYVARNCGQVLTQDEVFS